MFAFVILALALDYGTFATMLDLVNKVRSTSGRQPLRLSTQLSDAAQKYSQVQASRNTMGHSVDGTSFVEIGRAHV